MLKKILIIVSMMFVLLPVKAQEKSETQTTINVEDKAITTAQAGAPAKEAEIALHLDKTTQQNTQSDTGSKLIIGMMMILVLGAGAFVLIKKMAIPKQAQTQMQIKVLNQHFLGPKKSLAIVRVAGESILIGVTDQNINMIKSLSLLDEDVPEATPTAFDQVMSKITSNSPVADEDFMISGIKDVVSKKLQGMRNI